MALCFPSVPIFPRSPVPVSLVFRQISAASSETEKRPGGKSCTKRRCSLFLIIHTYYWFVFFFFRSVQLMINDNRLGRYAIDALLGNIASIRSDFYYMGLYLRGKKTQVSCLLYCHNRTKKRSCDTLTGVPKINVQ